MRPPTELELLAVFLAAMAVTRLMLAPRQLAASRSGCKSTARSLAGSPADPYRARYGANNPGAN